VYILSFILSYDLEENIDINQTKKIVSIMNILDLPYYFRYLISSRTMEKDTYEQVRTLLNTSKKHVLDIHFGTTQLHRKKCIESNLKFDKPIIDIGCGDGYYAVRFCDKLGTHNYYAFDIDTPAMARLDNYITKNNINNIKTYTNLKTLLEDLDDCNYYDIIISEVIEHLDYYKIKDFITNILVSINWQTVIITTPNKDFNIFYSNPTELRNYDHKQEFTRDEFICFMDKLLDASYIRFKKKDYLDIGDKVDGISCSQGILLTKN